MRRRSSRFSAKSHFFSEVDVDRGCALIADATTNADDGRRRKVDVTRFKALVRQVDWVKTESSCASFPARLPISCSALNKVLAPTDFHAGAPALAVSDGANAFIHSDLKVPGEAVTFSTVGRSLAHWAGILRGLASQAGWPLLEVPLSESTVTEGAKLSLREQG
jgi:hypothetical protein